MSGKQHRVDEANRVLRAIGAHGRRFFYSKRYDRTAQFKLDLRGRIWLTDEYTGRDIYVSYRGNWRHFSNGGTMRALIEALSAYIRAAEPISSRHFGPWPDWICEGDLWGYGSDAMAALRAQIEASPAIRKPVRHAPAPDIEVQP